MAKRISLSERRATDTRGVDVLFNAPGSQATAQVSEGQALETAGATAAAESGALKPALAKVTIYIRPEQVVAIETIQLAQRQQTGQKPDKSDLLQEAVDLLIAKYQV